MPDNMDQIKNFLIARYGIDNDDWHYFASRISKKIYKKGAEITGLNQIENYLSFVEKGVLRLFIPKEENDITFGFVFENEFVSAYDSFLTRMPTIYCIQALSDCILWQISFDDLQNVYKNTTIGNVIGRLGAEELLLKKMNREISLMNATAEERYLSLLSDQPFLFKHIPLKYLASFIGITPQALSRIRRRIC